MKQVIKHREGGLLNMIRRTDPMILQDDKLIIMTGYNADDTGHFWLVDGGYYIKTHYMSSVSHDEINWEVLSDWTTELTYNHINWGWDGYCNGFFLYNIFNPTSASEYDEYHVSFDSSSNYGKKLKYSTIYY